MPGKGRPPQAIPSPISRHIITCSESVTVYVFKFRTLIFRVYRGRWVLSSCTRYVKIHRGCGKSLSIKYNIFYIFSKLICITRGQTIGQTVEIVCICVCYTVLLIVLYLTTIYCMSKVDLFFLIKQWQCDSSPRDSLENTIQIWVSEITFN